MIRSFISQLWTNIKRSPLIAVLVFLQIVLTSYCLFNILWTFSEYDVNNTRVQGVYGKKSIYIVKRKPGLSQEDLMRVTGAFFGMEGEDNSDFEAFWKRTNELVNENEGIDTALSLSTPVYLDTGAVANAFISMFTVLFLSPEDFLPMKSMPTLIIPISRESLVRHIKVNSRSETPSRQVFFSLPKK